MTRRALKHEGVAAPQAHYSHAIVGGGAVYVAGQVPLDVHGHVTRILAKLHHRDRVQAVVLAYESGLVVPE